MATFANMDYSYDVDHQSLEKDHRRGQQENRDVRPFLAIALWIFAHKNKTGL